jgi:hypothetical protein
MFPQQMSMHEAIDVAEVMTQIWPHPELTETGIELLSYALMDSGLTKEEAGQALRVLMQLRHEFRPQVADVREATGKYRPGAFKMFAVTEEAPAAPMEIALEGIAAARAALRGGA